MSEWLDWGTAWKAIPLAVSALGTLKSWRNHWKGPRSLARFFHREAELILMTQDRDYYKNVADELIAQINERAALADFVEHSHASSPEVQPLQNLHPRDHRTTPTTRGRSRKPKPTSTAPPKS